jgi:hypothetical protein
MRAEGRAECAYGRGMKRCISFGSVILALAAGVACGESSASHPDAGGAVGTSSSAGKGGSSGVAGSSGGKATTGGGGSADQVKPGGNASGGVASSAGEGESAGADSATAGIAGAGGGTRPTDPRPECAVAPLIELSKLRLVTGAGPGETATLELEVRNGTPDFVSYNPVHFSCGGDAVANASDVLNSFGIQAGGTGSVELRVEFKQNAQPGDVAHCTVRGFISGKTFNDCANAQTETIDVSVE